MESLKSMWCVTIGCLALVLLGGTPVFAQNLIPIRPAGSDVSPRLRDLPALAGQNAASQAPRVRFLGRIPPTLPGASSRPGPGASAQAGPQTAAAAGTLLNFEGIGENSGAPSDANGAAGATQYVQWVNTEFAVYDKVTGTIFEGFPKPGNAIWAGFEPFNSVCAIQNSGDPIAQYDKLASRWVLTQFALPNFPNGPFYQCIAVSQTSDATGAYNRYVYQFNNMNDYPKVGIWPDAYYFTWNQFVPPFLFYAGPQVCAFDRAAMLAGNPNPVGKCTPPSFFGSSVGSLLSSDLDGATPPPANSPNFLLTMDFDNAGNGSQLRMWKASFAGNTISGPTVIPVDPFTIACPSTGGGACIQQPQVADVLDSLGDRLMYRLAYRNFGTVDGLLANHSVEVSGTGQVGVRWYVLTNPNSAVTVNQQGTYAPDNASRWMGSIAMDHMGNIALGYSVSSSTVFPGIRVTGRKRDTPPGTLLGELTIVDGGGSQLDTSSRWGDYSAMVVDPVDDCTFWYTQQYIATTGSFNWHTRIASFRFPTCAQ